MTVDPERAGKIVEMVMGNAREHLEAIMVVQKDIDMHVATARHQIKSIEERGSDEESAVKCVAKELSDATGNAKLPRDMKLTDMHQDLCPAVQLGEKLVYQACLVQMQVEAVAMRQWWYNSDDEVAVLFRAVRELLLNKKRQQWCYHEKADLSWRGAG